MGCRTFAAVCLSILISRLIPTSNAPPYEYDSRLYPTDYFPERPQQPMGMVFTTFNKPAQLPSPLFNYYPPTITKGKGVSPPLKGKESPHKPSYNEEEYVLKAEPTYTCPTGFLMIDRHCKREESSPAKLGCREGWRYSEGVCQGVEAGSPEYICDEGFHSEGNSCIREEVAPKQILCPTGFVISANQKCSRSIHTPPTPVCAEGHHLTTDNDCEAEEIVKPEVQCNPGFSLEGDQCIQKHQFLPSHSCKEEFEMSEGKCKLMEYHEPSLECPPGFGINEHFVCHKVVTTKGELQCPSGAHHGNGLCEVEEKVPSLLECPPGFAKEEIHDQCVKRDTVTPPYFCQEGYTLDNKLCVKQKGKSKTYPEIRCPKSFTLTDNNLCHKLTYAATIDTGRCPVGAIKNNLQKCVLYKYVKPTAYCLDGILKDIFCETYESRPAFKKCEPGFGLVHDKCMREIVMDPYAVCPNGSSLTKLGECLQVNAMEPDIHCPLEFKLIPGNPPLCSGQSSTPPALTCPNAYILMKSEHRGNMICEGRIEHPPQLECLDGYTKHGRLCMKIVSIPKRAVCPKGFELSFDQCIHTLEENPVVMCPVGYELGIGSQDTCVHEVITDVRASCPEGYQLDKLVGKCLKVAKEYNFKNEVTKQGTPDLHTKANEHKNMNLYGAAIPLASTHGSRYPESFPNPPLPIQDFRQPILPSPFYPLQQFRNQYLETNPKPVSQLMHARSTNEKQSDHDKKGKKKHL